MVHVDAVTLRIGALVLLGAIEWSALLLRYSVGHLASSPEWWIRGVGRLYELPPILFVVGVAVALFGGERLLAVWREMRPEISARRRWPMWLALHFGALAVTVVLAEQVLRPGFDASAPSAVWSVLGLLVSGSAAAVLWVAAVVHRAVLASAWRRVGVSVLVVVVLATLGMSFADQLSRWLWEPLGRSTLWVMGIVLAPIVEPVVFTPSQLFVDIPGLRVHIAPECTGFEGILLMAAFLAGYLWTFRAEFRWPRALWLFPLGIAVIWLTNALRLAALVVIAHEISGDVATEGFHAIGGVFAFCLVALWIAWWSRRSPWFAIAPRVDATLLRGNETAAMLLPFLVGIAAAMATGAFAHGADPFLFVRVALPVVVLVVYRSHYRELLVRPTVAAVAVGLVVFVGWVIVVESSLDPGAHAASRDQLATLPESSRIGWLVLRAMATIAVVPLAEELAFRGYLMRRLVDADFRSVPIANVGAVPLVVSSIAFGLVHEHVVAGIAAGLAYGIACRLRGGLVDAVVAHATTNGALVVYAVSTDRYALWW